MFQLDADNGERVGKRPRLFARSCHRNEQRREYLRVSRKRHMKRGPHLNSVREPRGNRLQILVSRLSLNHRECSGEREAGTKHCREIPRHPNNLNAPHTAPEGYGEPRWEHENSTPLLKADDEAPLLLYQVIHRKMRRSFNRADFVGQSFFSYRGAEFHSYSVIARNTSSMLVMPRPAL